MLATLQLWGFFFSFFFASKLIKAEQRRSVSLRSLMNVGALHKVRWHKQITAVQLKPIVITVISEEKHLKKSLCLSAYVAVRSKTLWDVLL